MKSVFTVYSNASSDTFWYGPILLLYHAECLGGFEVFASVEGDKVDDDAQYIIPELNFSCDGTVTQWKVGLESGGRGQSVNLQIWRPIKAGEYSLANEVTYTKMDDETIASVLVAVDGQGLHWVAIHHYVSRRCSHSLCIHART